MSGSDLNFRLPSFSTHLRHELSARNLQYAQRVNLPNFESRGQPPVICYLPTDNGRQHGNFLPETYRAILKNKNWNRRLHKVHTSARESLPRTGRRWCELDSSNSSDALLMNIFCFPGTPCQSGLAHMLGVEAGSAPQFGVKARVPLLNGRADRTEVDMKIGDLLVEAKLTESDFQCAPAALVESYRDFSQVFDRELLPHANDRYLSYQLIRNVLAAHAGQCSFCVMLDARRPDLREAWYKIMSAITTLELRLRCKLVTWQELSGRLPRKLQIFLEEKYGILNAEA
jgi:restriction endonuclease-like protein